MDRCFYCKKEWVIWSPYLNCYIECNWQHWLASVSWYFLFQLTRLPYPAAVFSLCSTSKWSISLSLSWSIFMVSTVACLLMISNPPSSPNLPVSFLPVPPAAPPGCPKASQAQHVENRTRHLLPKPMHFQVFSVLVDVSALIHSHNRNPLWFFPLPHSTDETHRFFSLNTACICPLLL